MFGRPVVVQWKEIQKRERQWERQWESGIGRRAYAEDMSISGGG
jgi:hypothetical protein